MCDLRITDAPLHAELVKLVRPALADAFDLRRMQAVDLLASLVMVLSRPEPAGGFGPRASILDAVRHDRLARRE
jgi:hypothetical protein